MQTRHATTQTRGQVLIDEVYRGPVDEHLERTRMRLLIAGLAIVALILVLACW